MNFWKSSTIPKHHLDGVQCVIESFPSVDIDQKVRIILTHNSFSSLQYRIGAGQLRTKLIKLAKTNGDILGFLV